MKNILKLFISLLFTWFFIHVIIISYDGLKDNINIADIGVVLGNKVENNGQPSKRLKSRLDKAYELYNNKYIKLIIVSGGVDIRGLDEAEVMKNYLISKGIPDINIIKDLAGNNTIMTAINTKNIMGKNNFKTIIIISQFYHISRTKLAFSKVGIQNVNSAHAEIFELRDFYSLFREFFAYYLYLLK